MSSPEKKRDLFIGISGTVLALVLLLIWIPVDVETGVIDVWRRTTRIGDAMLPTFAAIGCLIASVWVAIQALSGKALTPLHKVSLKFVAQMITVLALSLALILYTGPLLVWWWFADGTSYRQLLNTAPWKYAGFLSGGTLLVFFFIALIEHRLRLRNLFLAVLAAVIIAAIYDIPFDTLLLPPNGDY